MGCPDGAPVLDVLISGQPLRWILLGWVRSGSPHDILPPMRRSSRARLGLVCGLLLGLGLGSVLPIALEPDHYLEHGSRPPADEARVVLRAVDGDHQHEDAYFEPAQRTVIAPCSFCALLGKVHVLAADAPRFFGGLEARAAYSADATRLWASPRRGPAQPRAPPRA